MSAYVVAKAEIDALVTAAVRWSEQTPGGLSFYWLHGSQPIDAGTATRIGQTLWHANWYHAEGWAQDQVPDVPSEPTYEYEPLPGDPSPLLILRLLEHYTYQTAGEIEEWVATEANGFVRTLQKEAIARLPGLRDLPWGLGEDGRDIFLRQPA